MNTNFPPSPIDALSDLRPLLDVLREDLIESIDFGLRHFEKYQQEVDGSLHAHLSRHQLCALLDRRPLGSLGFRRLYVVGSGVHLVSATHQIRVLKSGHDIDPDTGAVVRTMPVASTRARREYYDQRPLFPDRLFSGPLRLLLLWDVSKQCDFAALDLLCPKYGESSRKSLEYYWRVAVPKAGAKVTKSSILESDLIPLPDIQIKLRPPASTGTEDARSG